MKKRKQPTKDNKPVTFKQLNQVVNQALKPVLDRLEVMDGRFILQDARIEALEKAVHNLGETFKDNFTKMYSHIDAFMKRTESNSDDDLAKYCTEKIAYPVYGRN